MRPTEAQLAAYALPCTPDALAQQERVSTDCAIGLALHEYYSGPNAPVTRWAAARAQFQQDVEVALANRLHALQLFSEGT